jgi:hypothetical protein
MEPYAAAILFCVSFAWLNVPVIRAIVMRRARNASGQDKLPLLLVDMADTSFTNRAIRRQGNGFRPNGDEPFGASW